MSNVDMDMALSVGKTKLKAFLLNVEETLMN